MSDQTTWTYIARHKASPSLIKIGASKNLSARINAIGCTLLVAVDADFYPERHVHELLADSRRAGEWFEFTPEVLAFVTQLVADSASWRKIKAELPRSYIERRAAGFEDERMFRECARALADERQLIEAGV